VVFEQRLEALEEMLLVYAHSLINSRSLGEVPFKLGGRFDTFDEGVTRF
jgi:hypothetical protein